MNNRVEHIASLSDQLFALFEIQTQYSDSDYILALTSCLAAAAAMSPDHKALVLQQCNSVVEMFEKGTIDGKPVMKSTANLFGLNNKNN